MKTTKPGPCVLAEGPPVGHSGRNMALGVQVRGFKYGQPRTPWELEAESDAIYKELCEAVAPDDDATINSALYTLLWRAVSGYRWMRRREYDSLRARTERGRAEANNLYAEQAAEFENLLRAIKTLGARIEPPTPEAVKDMVLRVEADELYMSLAGMVQDNQK